MNEKDFKGSGKKATHSNEELFCLLHDAKRIGYLLEFPQIKELYEKGEADHIRAYIERLGEDEAPAEQPDDNQFKILPTDAQKLKTMIQRGGQEEKTRIRELNDLITTAYKLCTKGTEQTEVLALYKEFLMMTDILNKAMTQIELIAEMGSEGDVELLKEKRKKGSW